MTECLGQGFFAKGCILRAGDGTTWGVKETDMLMNNCGDYVTKAAAEVFHPASERSAAGPNHFMRATEAVAENENGAGNRPQSNQQDR